MQLAVITGLWHGSLGRLPVQVVLVRPTASAKPYDIALVSTELTATATATAIVERYADRWTIEQAIKDGIEQSIKDGKDLLGAGDAHNRLPAAVARAVPFMMLTLTILTLWYHHARTAADDLQTRRTLAPWYRHKRHIAVLDMLIAFRRNRITATPPCSMTDLALERSRGGLVGPPKKRRSGIRSVVSAPDPAYART